MRERMDLASGVDGVPGSGHAEGRGGGSRDPGRRCLVRWRASRVGVGGRACCCTWPTRAGTTMSAPSRRCRAVRSPTASWRSRWTTGRPARTRSGTGSGRCCITSPTPACSSGARARTGTSSRSWASSGSGCSGSWPAWSWRSSPASASRRVSSWSRRSSCSRPASWSSRSAAPSSTARWPVRTSAGRAARPGWPAWPARSTTCSARPNCRRASISTSPPRSCTPTGSAAGSRTPAAAVIAISFLVFNVIDFVAWIPLTAVHWIRSRRTAQPKSQPARTALEALDLSAYPGFS